jgi:DNA-binding GntR family transcriptional regulator
VTYGTAPDHGVASSRIADALRAAILDGSYRPGERIRQEDVAARSGASRIPVREALRMLQAEGLVTLVVNSGAWVTRLTLAECGELYQIRERLEPLLLRSSLPGLDDAVIGRLADLAGAMERSGGDVDAFLRADREFHLASYSAAVPGETSQIITAASSPSSPAVRGASARRTSSTACCSTACAARTPTTPSACSSCTSGAPALS